jgi:hypothetical protein
MLLSTGQILANTKLCRSTPVVPISSLMKTQLIVLDGPVNSSLKGAAQVRILEML